MDIDTRTYNLCPLALESELLTAEKAGKLPKVLVAEHLCGQPRDMATIQVLGPKYCLRRIEDIFHAICGKYKGEFIGNGRYSDITGFSFHPVKIVITAESGMVLTNSDELATQMALLRSHGITRASQAVLRRGHQPTHVSNPKRQPARPSGGVLQKVLAA